MTPEDEDALERTIERRMDRIDREYLAGRMTTEEYDRAVAALGE